MLKNYKNGIETRETTIFKGMLEKKESILQKELNDRNNKVLTSMRLDKNGLVARFFDLNQELIKTRRKDPKAILDKFVNDEWKIKSELDKVDILLNNITSFKLTLSLRTLHLNKTYPSDNKFPSLLNTKSCKDTLLFNDTCHSCNSLK